MEHNNINESEYDNVRKSNLELPKNMVKKSPMSEEAYLAIKKLFSERDKREASNKK
jgi:hypothetical protein